MTNQITESDGYKKAKELADKIKSEKLAKEEVSKVKKKSVMTETKEKNLSTNIKAQGISIPKNIADMYKQTASVGTENISSQALPQIKTNEFNSKHRLSDDSKPTVGKLFYSPTKQEFDDALVSIVTVSRGFYTCQTTPEGKIKRKENGDADTRFNQLVGGVMLHTMQPFVLFASGTRWRGMNDFVKLINPMTKHKEYPIPMYAFNVKLGTELVETSNGENYVYTYDLVKNDENEYQLVADMDLIQVLLSAEEELSTMISSFIKSRECDRETGELISEKPVRLEATDAPSADYQDYEETLGVSDEIPF